MPTLEPLGSDHIQSTFGISQLPLNMFFLFATAINYDLELTHTDPFPWLNLILTWTVSHTPTVFSQK